MVHYIRHCNIYLYSFYVMNHFSMYIIKYFSFFNKNVVRFCLYVWSLTM
uniref:Uncharacterized protein n=1 Tax=Wuchereria bancrofti TaxID=6293 RepID=A0AAF5PHY2_WUCBA